VDGEAAPYRVQHLLDRARWDADAARDQLRDYVLEELSSPDAVLITDECLASSVSSPRVASNRNVTEEFRVFLPKI